MDSKKTLAVGIGIRVRLARTRLAISQQLAGARYTKSYISAIEKGLVVPSLPALEYLAARLGLMASQLLAGAEKSTSIGAASLPTPPTVASAIGGSDSASVLPDRCHHARQPNERGRPGS